MSIAKAQLNKLKEALNALESELPIIDESARLVVERLAKGHTIFACGNGGSATDSMHLCEELLGRYRGDRAPLPAVSLNTDTSVLTCIANDYGFEEIFARQVKALIRPLDILVGFSTSGNSENVLRALKSAKDRGATTILLTGSRARTNTDLADFCICAPSHDTERIQEIHTFILHTWLEYVEAEDWSNKSGNA